MDGAGRGAMTNMRPNPDQLALAQGLAPVYIATKLFEYAGRFLSAAAEEAIVRGLRRGLGERSRAHGAPPSAA